MIWHKQRGEDKDMKLRGRDKEKLTNRNGWRLKRNGWRGTNENIYHIIRCFAGPIGQNNLSTKCLMYLFFIISHRLMELKTLYFHFCNFIKRYKEINWKAFSKEFCKKSWKKILGTSVAWSTIRLSHCCPIVQATQHDIF